jgi:hypothetical protein
MSHCKRCSGYLVREMELSTGEESWSWYTYIRCVNCGDVQFAGVKDTCRTNHTSDSREVLTTCQGA